MKHNQTLRRGLGILLSLVMCLSLLPATALAAEPAAKTADFTTSPAAALALLNAAKTGDVDSTWADNTLTLNGVNFSTSAATAVQLPAGAVIELVGKNTITSTYNGYDSSCGISAISDLTIKGSGSLTVTGGTASYSYGICANTGNVNISDNAADVTAKGGDTSYGLSYGIYAGKSVNISVGSVEATGGKGYKSYGIYANSENVNISDNAADVTAKGGTATGGGSISYGIYAGKSVAISSGSIEAMGGTATDEISISYGIYANDGSVTIESSEVDATGGMAFAASGGISAHNVSIANSTVNATGSTTTGADSGSRGIYARNGSVTIESSEVDATGGTAYANSLGINAQSGIQISGENTAVTAKGSMLTGGNSGWGMYRSCGIYGSVTIANGKVDAAGNTAECSYGIYGWDMTISGGTVTATGGTATGDDGYSCGIRASNNVAISGENTTVTAKGGTATGEGSISYGIYGWDMTISGGHVTAQAKDSALNVDVIWGGTLDLSGYTGYRWRTSAEDEYTDSTTTEYAYDATNTYVEFSQGATVTTYTVSFDANGGSGSMDAVTGVSGSYTLPECGFTAPEGQRFKAWSVNGTEYAVGADITVSADTTVTAVWEVIPTYTVTFDPNGGTLTGWTSTKTEADGTVDYLPLAAREGYTFDGWYTAADGGEKVYTYVTVFTADTTVYAHWTPEADTKQITEAVFGLKGYTLGAKAEDIVITSYTEGLSLTGGYYESQGKPYSYLLGTVGNDPNDLALVTGPLEANTEYILILKADLNAGYDVGSGLTEADVTLNSTIAAADFDKYKEESTFGITFVLPVLTENDTPDATYTVTVNGSYAPATGAGEYKAGNLVTLAAGSRSGYTFSGWTSNDITIPNAGSADTSFVMPAQNVIVTANWTYNGGSSSGGSGSSGGSTVTPDEPETTPDEPETTPTEPAITTDGGTTVAGIETEVTTSGTTSTATVSQDTLEKAIEAAESTAGQTNTNAAVEISVETPAKATEVKVDLPAEGLESFADSEAQSLTISSGVGTVTISPEAAASIAAQAQGDTVTVTISAVAQPEEVLNDRQLAAVGDAPVYDLSVTSSGTYISQFGGGLVTVSLPYTLKAGEDPNGVVVYYVDDLGNIQRVQAMYDVKTQSILFTTNHFSLYMVRYEATAAAAARFTDVPFDAYYQSAVGWAVNQGITTGTTTTTFSPDASCTRGQMVTFLWRAAGSPKVSGSNPFGDVSADAYYYDAVLWAVENGITSGTSATTFAPDAAVTRAQTVTFLYRAAGSPAASGSGFSDVSSDAYYAGAVAWAVENGITLGTSDTTFSPNADCTRAQIVTFLYRAMEE